MKLATMAVLAVALAPLIGCQREQSKPPARTTPPSSLEPILDTLVPAALAKTVASGAVIAIVEAGRITLTKGYGLADKVGRAPMTDSTPIGVASVSKLVSAWGLLSLTAKGLLPLDRPIDSLARSWHLSASNFDRNGVTVRRLLSHTAGLGMLSVPCLRADTARPSLVDVLNGKAGDRGKVQQTQAPGKEWRYSGGGFTLLQLAAEEIAAKPFSALMRQSVFAPLGMNDSDYGATQRASATGYDDAGKPVAPFHCVGEAAAGLVTSARDMAKLLAEYTRVLHDSSAILSAKWLDTLATPIAKVAMTVDGKVITMGDAQMGLGHFIHRTRDGHRMLFHSGGNPGVAAYLLIDLESGNGLFMAVNSDSASDVLRAIVAAWGRWARTDPPELF